MESNSRARLAEFPVLPSSIAGTSTFSVAVSAGSRLKNWKTKPMWRRRNVARSVSFIVEASVPSTVIFPADGVSSSPSSDSSVVLPDPLGPWTATNSPGSTRSDTSVSAATGCSPRSWTLLTFSASIIDTSS